MSYRVGPGTVVTVEYDVFDAEGECAGGSEPGQPLTAIVGYGQLLPGVERALEGLAAGASRKVDLAAKDAYGPRDPEGVLEVDREEFPPDVAEGDRFEVEAESGERLVLRVLNVTDDAVVLDANHPLAGQRVRFDLRVLDVRPATEQELHDAAARLEAAESPDAADAVQNLVTPERLIRRGRRLNGGKLPGSMEN